MNMSGASGLSKLADKTWAELMTHTDVANIEPTFTVSSFLISPCIPTTPIPGRHQPSLP